MARSLSQTLTLTRHLSPKSSSSSSRLITLRAQSNLPFHNDQTDPATDSSATVDPLLRKLEDAIHRIIVRKSAPDWLPFVPGASYWVPPPRSRSHGLAQLVEKLANPLTEEESMSMTTVRGWPSSSYFIQGLFFFYYWILVKIGSFSFNFGRNSSIIGCICTIWSFGSGCESVCFFLPKKIYLFFNEEIKVHLGVGFIWFSWNWWKYSSVLLAWHCDK